MLLTLVTFDPYHGYAPVCFSLSTQVTPRGLRLHSWPLKTASVGATPSPADRRNTAGGGSLGRSRVALSCCPGNGLSPNSDGSFPSPRRGQRFCVHGADRETKLRGYSWDGEMLPEEIGCMTCSVVLGPLVD